jgi:hypothetical protein
VTKLSTKSISELLTDLYAAYPGIKLKAAEEEALPRVWRDALAGQDAAQVRAAVAKHIRTSRFWPSPAEILALIEQDRPTQEAKDSDPPLVRAAIAEGIGAIQARHWFGDVREILEPSPGKAVLVCASQFKADWLLANFQLAAILTRALGCPVSQVGAMVREDIA